MARKSEHVFNNIEDCQTEVERLQELLKKKERDDEFGRVNIYEDYFDVVSVSGFHDRLRQFAAEPRAGYLRSRRQIKGTPI